MKNIIYLFALSLVLVSCGKEDPGISVDDYIILNNLTTTELAEGVHIIIHEPGDSNRPNINSNLEVAYEGKLTHGKVFDSNDFAEFPLSGVIRGWQIGLQEIGIGGKCTLIIPSTAGYGSAGTSSIPGGATLIFEIDLLDIVL